MPLLPSQLCAEAGMSLSIRGQRTWGAGMEIWVCKKKGFWYATISTKFGTASTRIPCSTQEAAEKQLWDFLRDIKESGWK